MTYRIELNEEDLKALDQGIQQLPFYIAAPLLQKINEQIKPKEEPEPQTQPTE